MSNIVGDEELPKPKNESILRGADVKKMGPLLKASIVSSEMFTFPSGDTARKLTISYKNGGTSYTKNFTLNKTNVKTLVDAYGKDTDEWVGESITLTTSEKNNPETGDVVDSIVVIAA